MSNSLEPNKKINTNIINLIIDIENEFAYNFFNYNFVSLRNKRNNIKCGLANYIFYFLYFLYNIIVITFEKSIVVYITL